MTVSHIDIFKPQLKTHKASPVMAHQPHLYGVVVAAFWCCFFSRVEPPLPQAPKPRNCRTTKPPKESTSKNHRKASRPRTQKTAPRPPHCHLPRPSILPPTMLSRQALLRSMRTAAPQRAILSQTRTFAAAAPAAENVKPPVALFGVDGTYATALVWPIALLLRLSTR